MNDFNILSLALVAGAATFLGVWLGTKHKYGERAIAFGSAFAGVIMILISAVELIPAAILAGGWLESALFVFFGVAIIALANYVIPHLHTFHDIKSCDQRSMARASCLIAIGLILHDFPEGFAIPSSFGASSSLGFTVIISSFLHNIPEGYAMTVASCGLKGGFGYKSAAWSTLASLLGAALGILLLNSFGGFNVIFLSIAAGAMLYISFHELIPLAFKHHEKTAMLWGGAAAVATFLVLSYI